MARQKLFATAKTPLSDSKQSRGSNICGASEAKHHIRNIMSVRLPRCAFAGATNIPLNTGYSITRTSYYYFFIWI